MSRPHVLVMPAPAQGHVIPLLEFSQCLAKHGFRVTFVNTEYDHKRVVESLEGKNYLAEQIRLVSIPDGMEPWEDRNDLGKLIEKCLQVMPGKLEKLIEEINSREDEKIDCFIADGNTGWSMEVAKKMNVRGAVFWPSSAASVAFVFRIPKLIDDGIIDSHGMIPCHLIPYFPPANFNFDACHSSSLLYATVIFFVLYSTSGTPMSMQMFRIAPKMPEMNSRDCFWAHIGDLTTQKIFFDLLERNSRAMMAVNFHFCNSTYELESDAFTMFPELLPIGPLIASNRQGNSAGYFWREDSNCLKWLDQQQPSSVIYAAFGSLTILDQVQFQELALGLELCNRPFLWVVRPDITTDANDRYPEGFQERVAARGQMISWAPQQKVLNHPSIACFLSHCGWNSTMEGVSNGIPFLCWPYFGDQFLNERYICDFWKVGLKFDRDEGGIITREEIKNKVDQLLGNQDFKARALELKEKAMSSAREGGSSYKTFQNFLQWVKTNALAHNSPVTGG
ncbi:UDP-glycosyltransferase 83A1 [Citrus sinensis]|uniref:UDP-glycosyltransferase 83A1 n=1 Tax=Citrus sinensis TaxID=2711 RepID=A0ACB8KFF8_CITSI|nr:UDP-glycosyltransferase 83A1 [Citrus sinensis]